MHVLGVGGAGYIGSRACKLLAKSGFVPLVSDDPRAGIIRPFSGIRLWRKTVCSRRA
jgi:UDP-glucose 4-epimerase